MRVLIGLRRRSATVFVVGLVVGLLSGHPTMHAQGQASCGVDTDDRAIVQEPKQKDQSGPEARSHRHSFTNPDELAKRWNDPGRDRWQHPEEIVAALALKPGATAADIGAGTGYMVAHLSRAVGRSGTVIAVDAEAAMIDYLTKRSADLGQAKVVPRQVGLQDPEFRADEVDGVLMLDVWHHIEGREAYAGKVFKGLQPGGRFVVVDYEIDAEGGPPKVMRLEPGQVVRELEAAGFRAEVVRESMPKHYMIVGLKPYKV